MGRPRKNPIEGEPVDSREEKLEELLQQCADLLDKMGCSHAMVASQDMTVRQYGVAAAKLAGRVRDAG